MGSSNMPSAYSPAGISEFYPKKVDVTASKSHNDILSTLLSKGDYPLIEKYKKELDAGLELVHRNSKNLEYLLEQDQLKERVYQEALQAGDVDTALGIASAGPTQPTDYAVERAGIEDLIIAGGENVQNRMLENPGYVNYLKNSAVLQTFIDKKKQEEIDTQSWGDFFFDIAAGAVPFNQLTKDLKNYGLSNFAKAKADEFASFMNLTPDEFEQRLPEFWAKAKDSAGWFNSDEGKAFSDLVRLNRWNDSSFLSMDNLSYVDALAVVPATRLMRTPQSLLHGTGNVQAAAQMTATGTLAKVPAATHNVLPGIMQAAPQPNLHIATPSGYALANTNPQFTQVASSILSRIDQLYKQADATAVEQVLDATRTEYAKDRRFNDRIVDLQYDNQFDRGDPNRTRTFAEKVNIYIGDVGGVPFQSVYHARQYIDNTPGLLNPTIVPDVNGNILVRTQGRPYEAGSIQKLDLSKSVWLGGIINKVLGKKLTLPDTMFGKQLAADTTLEFARNEIQALDKTISTLSPGQLQDLELVLKKGSVEVNPSSGKTSGVWYDPVQLQGEYNNLFGRNPTKKEIDAYFAVQAKSDIAWLVRNEVTRRELAFNNYKAYKTQTGSSFLVKDVTEEKPSVSIADWRTSKSVPLDQDPNVKILRFSQPQKLGKHKFKHVAVDKDTTLDELPDQVVNYNPGGSRGYQGDYFLKQVNAWRDQNTGKTVVDNPRVLSVYTTRAEAQEYAEGLNRAIDAFNGYQQGNRSFQFLDNTIQTTFRGRYTTQDFLRDIADERIDPKYRIEITNDKAVPTQQNELVAGPNTYMFLDDSTPNADILAKQGQLYFSERGDVLTKLGTNEPVDIVSPLDMIHRSTDAAMRSGAYWNYRLHAAGSWFESLKAAGYPISSPDALKHIMGPDIDVIANGVTRQDLVQLRAIQQHFKAVFNPPDPLDHMVAQWAMGKLTQNEWQDAIIGKGLKKFAQFKLSEKMRLWMFLKTFAFDITQPLLQGLTTAQTVAIAGPNAVGSILRKSPTYLFGYGFERMGRLTDYVRNEMATMAGLTRAEWDENFNFISNSGFLHIGGTHGYLDNDILQRQVKSAFGRSLAWVGEKAVAPFTRAEQMLRGNAITVAVDEFRKANPGVSLMRQDAREWIIKRADSLNINMHRVNNADIQKGFWGIITQFMAFQQRSLEQIFSSKAGLTKTERLRVLGMHLAMHGSYGVPGGALIAQIANDYGMDPEVLKQASKGLVDQAVSYALGTPIDSSARYSPFSNDIATSTVKGLYDWWYSQSAPEFNVTDLAPSIDALAKIYGGSMSVWAYLQAGNVPTKDPSVDWQLFKETVGTYFSSMNRAVKAGLILNEQMIRNSKGNTVIWAKDSEQAAAWSDAAFLGMQPEEVHDMYLQQNQEKLSKAKFNFIADRLFELDVKVIQANGNEALINDYRKKKENLYNTLTPSERFQMYGTLQQKYRTSVLPLVDQAEQRKAIKDEVTGKGQN